MAQRVAVYIDGYNLYYSRLQGTPYKWLDLVALFRDVLLPQQLPDAEVVAVYYFTAPALAKFARHGKASETAQNEYLRALRARWPDLLQIVLGYHQISTPSMLRHVQPPDRQDRVKVWLLEEKQTDVNIALQFYRDAAKGLADHFVICSNDSDLVPAVRAVREDFPAVKLGLITPLPEPQADRHRYPNQTLLALSDWSRRYLRDDELQRAQLPDALPTRKKAARKPAHWFLAPY